MNCVLNGILRACGRQALGARLQLMTYWVCGLPLAYWAAFKMGLGVKVGAEGRQAGEDGWGLARLELGTRVGRGAGRGKGGGREGVRRGTWRKRGSRPV